MMARKKGATKAIWDNQPAREALTLAPEHQLVLRCTHCNDRYVLALPCSMRVITAVLDAYGDEHRHPEAPTRRRKGRNV